MVTQEGMVEIIANLQETDQMLLMIKEMIKHPIVSLNRTEIITSRVPRKITHLKISPLNYNLRRETQQMDPQMIDLKDRQVITLKTMTMMIMIRMIGDLTDNQEFKDLEEEIVVEGGIIEVIPETVLDLVHRKLSAETDRIKRIGGGIMIIKVTVEKNAISVGALAESALPDQSNSTIIANGMTIIIASNIHNANSIAVHKIAIGLLTKSTENASAILMIIMMT